MITAKISSMKNTVAKQILFFLKFRSVNEILKQTTQSIFTASQVVFYSLIFSNLTFIPYVNAGPTGGNVVGGSGSINHAGLNTTINQLTRSMAINWDSYNLNVNERVQYIQPDSSSISLNRILSNNGSEIHGRIDANGQVILVNPHGVFFGPTSQINVGGLIASGLDISPTDFMNGNYIFNEVLGADGTVINSGLINASLGGNVALIGKQVKNEGVINARLGAVSMAAGKEAVLTFDHQGLIGVKITKEILQDELGIDPALINSGEINAENGRVLLTASVSRDVFSQAVNTGDIEQATSVLMNEDGSFSLGGGSDVVNTGVIDVSSNTTNLTAGKVVVLGENVTSSGVIKANASSANAGEIELHAKNITLLSENSETTARAELSGIGGTVKVLGDRVGLIDESLVDVSGAKGGGQALIGGDYQGKNNHIRNSLRTYVGENTLIKANATVEGNGGKVILWGDDITRFYGNISATGIGEYSLGGFTEVSGKNYLDFNGLVDLTSGSGHKGTLLLDPDNIVIESTGTDTIASSDLFSDNEGTDTSISALTITTAMGTSSVELRARGDITVNDAITVAGTNNRNLTLRAADDITVNQAITLGTGDVTLTAGDDGCVSNTNGCIAADGDRSLFINADISTTGDVFLRAADDVIFATTGTVGLNGVRRPNSLSVRAGSDITVSSNITTNGSVTLTAADSTLESDGITQAPQAVTGVVTLNSGATVTTTNNLFDANGTSFNSGAASIVVGTNDIDLNGVNGSVTLGNLSATGFAGSDLLVQNATSISQQTNTVINIARNALLGTDGTTASITLNQSSGGTNNSFGGVVDLQTDTATLIASGNIQLNSGSTINGNLNLTSTNGGLLSANGPVTVSNGSSNATATFNTTGNITFSDGSNDIDRVSIINGADVNIRDNVGNLGLSANSGAGVGGITGTLTARANNGSITDFGEINVGGTSNLRTNSGSSIVLDTAANTFTGNITLDDSGGNFNNVTINNTAATSLNGFDASGTVTVSGTTVAFGRGGGATTAGNLNVTATSGTAGNIITQAGDLDVSSGTTTISSTQDVLLDRSGNDFNIVTTTTAGNLTLADTSSIVLGNTTTTGTLSVTSGNNSGNSISQTGGTALNIGSDATFTTNANDQNNNVTLMGAGNQFNGSITVTADRARITDSSASGMLLGNIVLDSSSQTSRFFATGGGISQVANTAIKNDSTSSITEFDAGANNIILQNFAAGDNALTNDFSFVNVLNANNVLLSEHDFIALGDISVANDLTVSSGLNGTNGSSATNYIRNASATSTVDVGGLTTLTSRNNTSATDYSINLNSSSNNFNDVTIVNAADVVLVDSTAAINLQSTNALGSLDVTANGTVAAGSSTINNLAAGTLNVNGSSSFTVADGQSIDLSSNNTFTTDPVFSSAGSVNNITVRDSTNITMQDDLSITGDLNVTGLNITLLNTAVGNDLILTATETNPLAPFNLIGDITQSTLPADSGDSLVVGGLTTLVGQTITLDHTGNDFQGNVVVNNVDSVVTLVDGAGGIQLGDTASAFVSNSLDVISTGGNISQANSITTGVTVLDAGANNIVLNTDPNNNITGNVSITNANDASIENSGALAINDAIVTNDLNLTSGGVLTLGGASQTVNVTRNLTTVSRGETRQGNNAILIVDGVAQLTARNLSGAEQNINLNSTAGNQLNTVNIVDAAIVNIRDSVGAIGIQGNIRGDLSLISTETNTGIGDVISNTGELNVGGLAAFTISNGENINLDNALNTFSADALPNDVQFTGASNITVSDDSATTRLQNNLTLSGNLTVNATDLTFQTTTVNGTLRATSSTGQIKQDATTTLNIGADTILDGGLGGIDLQEVNNIFTGTVSLSTTASAVPSNVFISGQNQLNLTSSNIAGDLTASADSIIQTTAGGDGIVVSGASLFTVTDGSSITLDNAENQFNGIAFASDAGITGSLLDVSITNNGSLDLQGLNLTGDLTAVATGGNITNSGKLVVTGLTQLDANNITLNHTDGAGNFDNDFNDVNIINGAAVNIADANDINFTGVSTITNALTVQSYQGGITDNENVTAGRVQGTLQVTNGATFNTNNGNIVLDNGTHDFNSVSINTASNATITDVNSIDIRGSSIGGDLTVIADADANDVGTDNTINNLSGNISVGGTTSLSTSDAGDILLARAGSNHSMAGPIIATNHSGSRLNDVQINNSSDTNLQSVNASSLLVNAGGNILDSGIINVSGATTLSSTGDILLNSAANDNVLSSLAVVAANNVNVTNSTALTLDAINMNGQLTVQANGISTTSDLLANTGMDLNAGTGTLSINNNLTSNGGSLLIAAQDIDQATGTTISGPSISITTTTGDFNQNGDVNNSAGNLTMNIAQSLNMAASSNIDSTGNIDITSGGNQAIASLTSTGGIITSTSNNGAITDANADATNYTASTVVIRADSGIGSGDSIETVTSELDVINNGTGGGLVEIDNTGSVLITNLVNSGDINFTNDTDVTIDKIDAGFTVGTLQFDVAEGSVFGVDRGAADFYNIADITADAAFITVNGEFGTFDRPIILNINSEFFLASTISSTFFQGGPPPINNDTSDLQFSVFDSINSVSGQQLIEVESIADIDPAIFTELHNYNQEDVSIRMPRDQVFEDELEAYDRQ